MTARRPELFPWAPRAVRVLLLACLASLPALDSCAGADALAVQRLRPDAPVYSLASGFDSPVTIVVRDAAGWVAAWQRIFARHRMAPPLPQVDFRRNMVVVAAMGRQRSGGYAIRITRAYHEDGRTVVEVTETSPAPGCVVPAALVSPVDVALVTRRQGPVEFRVTPETAGCH